MQVSVRAPSLQKSWCRRRSSVSSPAVDSCSRTHDCVCSRVSQRKWHLYAHLPHAQHAELHNAARSTTRRWRGEPKRVQPSCARADAARRDDRAIGARQGATGVVASAHVSHSTHNRLKRIPSRSHERSTGPSLSSPTSAGLSSLSVPGCKRCSQNVRRLLLRLRRAQPRSTPSGESCAPPIRMRDFPVHNATKDGCTGVKRTGRERPYVRKSHRLLLRFPLFTMLTMAPSGPRVGMVRPVYT